MAFSDSRYDQTLSGVTAGRDIQQKKDKTQSVITVGLYKLH